MIIFKKDSKSSYTGHDLAAELAEFVADHAQRVSDRNDDVHSRLAELEAERKVLNGLEKTHEAITAA
jgi:NADH dehydrogenase FAD-containing subunit